MWSCHVSAVPATWLWGSSRAEAVPLYFRVTSLHVTAKAFVMDLDLATDSVVFPSPLGGAGSRSSGRSLFPVPSRVGFPYLSCGDIWARYVLTVGCPVHWRMFSSVPGLHPPDAGSTTTPAVKVKMLPDIANVPREAEPAPVRTTGLVVPPRESQRD